MEMMAYLYLKIFRDRKVVPLKECNHYIQKSIDRKIISNKIVSDRVF